MTGTRATGTPARQGTVRMSAYFVVSRLSGKSCRGCLCATRTMVKRVSVTHLIMYLFDQHFLRLCTEETKTAPRLPPPQFSVGGFIVVVPILIQEHCLAVDRHEVESQVPVSLWCREQCAESECECTEKQRTCKVVTQRWNKSFRSNSDNEMRPKPGEPG